MPEMESPLVKQCCAAFYGSDVARLLLGDSFHPGGVALTERLGSLLQLSPHSHVLDAASGRGTSAFHLATAFGCCVTGVDLSEENLALARRGAAERNLSDQVKFERADAERLPFEDAAFDAILCECAFCTFPDKKVAAREFVRVLKPGGQVGISDLTRTAEAIPELEGLLAWIACIGDAMPAERYQSILANAGLRVQATEDRNEALIEMVRQVQSRLLAAEVMSGLKKIDLLGVDFSTAKQFANAALNAIREGKLGYGVFTAVKPVDAAAT